MQEEKKDVEQLLGRRQFTLASAMAVLSGVAITITSACGGSDYNPGSPNNPTPTPTPPASGDKTGTISSNHNHSAVITSAQLTAGAGIALNIQGQATHPHMVELSNSDIASIAANQRVSKESSTDNSHSHTVTFN